jgi:gas vesicle protein
MADRDEFGAFLIGFVVGTMTGAMASLLLAPQSGEKTREVIKEKAIELREKASTTVDDAYKQAEAAAEEARIRFDELAKMTKERADDLQRRGTMILEEQKAKLAHKEDEKPGEEAAPAA